MLQSITNKRPLGRLLLGLGLGSVLAASGCQIDVGGQTLPSPYWYKDDIQYFPAGPEFKLLKEAEAQQAFREEGIQGEQGGQAEGEGMPGEARRPRSPAVH